MKAPKIIRDFTSLPDKGLEARASNVASSMKGNAYFPTPGPSLEDLDAARLLFITALSAAQYHDRLKLSLKNDAKKKLRAVLSSLAYYVESVAQGDKTILMSSGFKISSDTVETPAVAVINNFKVEHGKNSGQMRLSATRVKGVDSYSFYFGIDAGENTVYDHITKTRARTIISDLKVGQTYSFYMKAIGTNEKFVQSITITKVVS